MDEGAGNSPGEKGTPDSEKGMSRRALFGFVVDAAKKASLVGAAVAVTRGLGFSPRAEAEYLFGDGPVRVIKVNHRIGADRDSVSQKYKDTGDLGLSQWTSQASLDEIDQSMRTAKAEGRPYFYSVDSMGDEMFANETARFPWLPRPNLTRQGEYPDKTFLVSSDIDDSYNLQSLQIEVPQGPLFALIKEAKGWYGQLDSIANLSGRSKMATEAAAEWAIASGLVAAGVSNLTRRKLLGIIAGIGAAQVYKNSAVLLNAASSWLPDDELQKVSTVVTDITTNDKFADDPTDLSVKARTALTYEKNLQVAREHKLPGSDQQMPVDMVYGSGHGVDLPRITTDTAYRRDVIKNFMRVVLTKFDATIEQKYPELRSNRKLILETVANSFLNYSISQVNWPWGEQSISPAQIPDFEKNLLTVKPEGTCNSLRPLVDEVLKGFDEQQDVTPLE